MPSRPKSRPARHPKKARPSHRPKPRPSKSKTPPRKPAVARPAKARPAHTPVEVPEAPAAPPRTGDDRQHVLSLSFLRDGDEFLARLETDAGQITELKNRSLDQLLTLVANELEDLLE
jgi:hypothetical protein